MILQNHEIYTNEAALLMICKSTHMPPEQKAADIVLATRACIAGRLELTETVVEAMTALVINAENRKNDPAACAALDFFVNAGIYGDRGRVVDLLHAMTGEAKTKAMGNAILRAIETIVDYQMPPPRLRLLEGGKTDPIFDTVAAPPVPPGMPHAQQPEESRLNRHLQRWPRGMGCG